VLGPYFADIDPLTFNLSPAAVRHFVDKNCEVRSGAAGGGDSGQSTDRWCRQSLMPVASIWASADMDPLMAIAKEYRLKVIEDAAQAIGTEYRAAYA